MNCTNCNAVLEPNAKFCGDCGQLVSPQSNAASAELSCTNCGAEIEPGFEFCGECGHPVSSKPLPSGPAGSAATLLEEPPPAPRAEKPRETPPPLQALPPRPSAHISPVEPSPPASSAVPTVMAQDVTPQPSPPQRSAAPPPAPGAQGAVYQGQPVDPPKKGRSGCTIILILLAFVIVCCVGSVAVVLFAINNTDFDFSSTGFDLEFLEQFRDVPFLDQILNDGTAQPFFDDFFDSQVNLTLRNAHNVPACFVYISPSDNDEWGDDWLGEGEVIPPGDTRTFALEPNQVVDISASDCDGSVLYEVYGISLSNQEVEITLDSAP